MERKLELPNKKALLPFINSVELNKIFDSKIIDLKPEDALKEVGIDVNDKNFWKNGISQIESQLKEATALAKKLGKI